MKKNILSFNKILILVSWLRYERRVKKKGKKERGKKLKVRRG